MDTCSACGAALSEAVDWCGQCFAPVRRGPGGRVATVPATAARQAQGRPGTLQAPGSPSSTGGAPWQRTRDGAPPKLEAAPVYSRWRSGPTSFGPGGRLMLSIGLLIAMAIGYPMVRGAMVAFVGFDVPGNGFVMLYTGLAIPTATFLLLKVWRPTRIS